MKKQTLIPLIILAVILAASLFNSKTTPSPRSDIVIGAVLSQTGFASAFGEHAQNAMTLAAEEINNAGGIHGRKVVIKTEDDKSSGKDAVTSFQKLAEIDQVDGIIGGVFDFIAQPLFPLAEQKKLTFISPTNFYIKGVLEPGNQSFVLYPPLETVIAELRGYYPLQSKEVQNAIIHYQSDFGKEITRTLQDIMTTQGKVLIEESYTTIGTGDFKTQIIKLKQQNVDTVFLDMLDMDIISFKKQADTLGFKAKIITYTTFKDVIASTKDLGVYEGTTMINWEVATKGFDEQYQKRFGKLPERGAVNSYKAVYVLADAIANATDKTRVAEYIASHSIKTPLGIVSFNTKHAIDSTPIEIVEVKDGKLTN